MRQLLIGLGVFGCLAAALFLGTPNPGWAFPQAEEHPEASRPQAHADHENMHGGQFDSFGQGYIRMRTEGGNSHVHNVNEQTQVFIDGEAARLNNLRTGDRIQVTMGENNVVTKIDIIRNAARQGAAPAEGKQFSRRPDFEDQPEGQGELQAKPEITPWLGVVLNDAEEGQEGVVIRQTYPSGPAARAGIRGGDVLVQINGKNVASPDEVARLIAEGKVSEPIEMVVLRGEERFPIKATLANRNDFLFDAPKSSNQEQGQEGSGEFDHSHIPDHAMMLEQHRYFAEQHERIEMKLDLVLEELEALRKQMGHGPAIEAPETEVPDPARNPAIEERPEVPKVPLPETEAIKPDTEIPEAPSP